MLLRDGGISHCLLQNPLAPTFLGFPFLLVAPLPGSQACFPLQIHLSTTPSITPNLTAQEEATGPVELRSPRGCPGQNPHLTPSSPERGAPNRYHPAIFHTTTWSEVGPAWKRDVSKTHGQECNTMGQMSEERLPC